MVKVMENNNSNESLNETITIIDNLSKTVNNTINLFQIQIQKINDAYKRIMDSDYLKTLKNISEFLDSLTLDKKKKEKIEKFATKWSDFGISILRKDDTAYIVDPPKNEEEMHRYLDTYYSFEKIQEMKNEFEKNNRIYKKDFIESVILLKNKMYKASLMMLFSIIDGIVIRSQKAEKPSKHADLPNQYAKNICDKENIPFLYFESYLLGELFVKYYERGDNFDNENNHPNVNRNFIAHGMSTRNLNKYDCLKLISVLQHCSYHFES